MYVQGRNKKQNGYANDAKTAKKGKKRKLREQTVAYYPTNRQTQRTAL